jgi:hypothetical protein
VKHGPITATVSLVLLLDLALGPTGAAAGGERAGSLGISAGFAPNQFLQGGHHEIRPGGFFAPHQFTRHSFAGRPVQSNAFGPHHFDRRHFSFHRPFTGFGGGVLYVAPPAYGYSAYSDAAPFYDQEGPYSAPAVYGQPAMTAAIAPAPPPPPSVIEYSTGRYELRGDGVTVPYTWQWIANVPPPPPPPAAAPAAASAPTATAAPDRT